MANDPRVEQLLEEIVASGRPPEEVCRACPELLPLVLDSLQRVRAVEAEIAAIFPTHSPKPGGAGSFPTLTDSPLPVVPGYTVLSVLGRGGMGVVYKAQHQKLNRTVAIKMLLSGGFAAPAELARFMREAQAIAALRHPNIVQVYDVGDLDGRPYFTMEYVEGGSLAQKLAGVPQPARQAATMVATLAEAVQVAHNGGIVHRDVKPANILLTADGTPKITDFGLARRFEEGSDLTLGGTRLGTPSYMSPEQAIGREGTVGPSADIYSLGAVLYEMLTGRPPFRAETPAETERQLISEEPARPSQLNVKIPRDLETICLKCLSKEPQRRYASAAALAEDLHRFLSGEPIAARRIGLLGRVLKWCRRRPIHATLFIVVSAAAVAILSASLWLSAHRAATARSIDRDLADLAQAEQLGDWAASRSALERATARLSGIASESQRRRIEQARQELDLVAQLDHIRLNRAILVTSRFDERVNRSRADEAYESAFRAAQLGDPAAPMEQVAARVSSSAVVIALLAALDDWGVCAVDKNRREWTLGVARRADRFESPWRTRARDPNVLGDPVMYAALMRSAPVDTESVQLLTAIAERRGNGGGEVVPFLMRVQAFHPDDFWANTSLGEALVHKGDATGAIAYYVAAVALRPTSAVAHDNLGTALGRCGRLDSAMDELRRAIRIEPEFAHAHSSLGNCLKLNRQFEEAVAEHREAVRLDPQNPGYHSNLGTALENISQVADAIREYRASIQIAPHYPAAHLNLGAALCKAGQYDEGLQECREAARLDPEDPDAHSVLGRKLAAVHRMNDALGEFEAASRLNPRSAECRADVGIALAELGNVDKAVEMHRQALALDPECNASTVQLRRELIQNGRTQEVYAIWQSALLADPPAFGARNGFAEFSLYLERQDDYQRECQTLVRRFGTDADAGLLGRVAEVCLLAPSSDEDVNAAAALIERSGLGMEFAKGLLEYRRGHLEAALPLLQGAAHHDEGVGVGPAPYFVLAIIQHRRGEDREARRILADAILQASWREADAGDRTAWTWHALRRQAEIEILPNLPAFLAGTYRPRDNDERFALMGACQFKNLHHVLAGLYRDAFQADPTLPRSDRAAFKYNAACDAALAGSTRGENAVPLADEERARWRDQARRWLRDDLDAVAQGANGADQDRNRAHQVLMQWRSDPDLGGLRDPDRLATLSDPEREECLQLWAEVDRVLALTQEPR